MKRAPRNEHANRAVEFIQNLKLTGDFYGQPVRLRRWQEDIIRRLFGTLRKDGLRQYNRAFLFLPRGASKTTIASWIVLYSLIGLGVPSQQILSAATSKEQAGTLYDLCKQAVEQDETLRSLVEVVGYKKRLVRPDKSSFYWAMSSDTASALSFNPSLLILDELEAWAGKDVELHDHLTSSMGKRAQCLTIYIATGHTERHPLMVQELEYAKRVEADPSIDPAYLPCLHYARDDEPWDDEKTWRKANPAAGDFFDINILRQECKAAQLIPSKRAVFEAFRLNRFTQSLRTWIPDDTWVRNDGPPSEPGEDITYTAGLDLAAVKDSNALVLYGARPDGKYDIIPFFWVAESQIEKRYSADMDFATWCRSGIITATEGETADQQRIYDDILAICQQYQVKLIACDPYGARQWLAPALESAGIPIKYIPQTVTYLSEPLKTLERQALNSQLCHGGHPVLRWQLSCAWVRPDGNANYFLNKSKSSGQVDGVAALTNAIAAWQYESMEGTAPAEPEIWYPSMPTTTAEPKPVEAMPVLSTNYITTLRARAWS
jgi:phage terminase large subunit-like protein